MIAHGEMIFMITYNFNELQKCCQTDFDDIHTMKAYNIILFIMQTFKVYL